MKNLIKIASFIGKNNEALVAGFIILIVALMIVPFPAPVIDALITINIGLSVLLLMATFYVSSPLNLSSFPSIILITTLFRLSLSITTTKMILLEADAGKIVASFGELVVSGNLFVGLVVFLIIAVVQFLVITKGSERVAEVSARFSLDGMPGKQMSIDSDLRAGAITQEQAKERRSTLERESHMYGSLDGAMKFVKGDAIAGILIVLINLLGGVSVGVFYEGKTSSEALNIYSILTIGDALVSQIPALLISLAAGILVTRSDDSSEQGENEPQNLGAQINRQLTQFQQPLYYCALLLALFAFLPGFPTFSFLLLSSIVASFAIVRTRLKQAAMRGTEVEEPIVVDSENQEELKVNQDSLADAKQFNVVDPILFDLALSFRSEIDQKTINTNLNKLRSMVNNDLGVPLPGIHIRFNNSLPTHAARLSIYEIEVFAMSILSDHVMIPDRIEDKEVLGEHCSDQLIPALNKTVIWVPNSHKDMLDTMEVRHLNTDDTLIWMVQQAIYRNMAEFMGIQETKNILDIMEKTYGELVKEAQRIMPIHKITEILKRLVSEHISIRNFRHILENIVSWGQKEKDIILLVEYIRASMGRYICTKHSTDNTISALLIDSKTEDTIREAIRQTSMGSYLDLAPEHSSSFMEQIKGYAETNNKLVIVTTMEIRRFVRKLIERDLFDTAVLSTQEITPDVRLSPIAYLTL